MRQAFACLILASACLRPALADPAQPAVEYAFERRTDGSAVTVTASFAGDADGATEVAVQPDWGGVSADPAEFDHVVAAGPDAAPLNIAKGQGCAWTITHTPGQRITLTYDLRQPADRAPLPPGHNDYRTRVTPDLFQMIGNHGLLYPEHLCGEQPREYRVEWRGFDLPGFHAVCSFGAGATQAVTATADQFRQSLFIAGRLAYVQRDIKGTRVGVVISGDDWGFTPEQFGELTFKIVQTEREFFDDFSDPWYLISVTPEGHAQGGSFSLGGTALTNCFALYCNAGISLDENSHYVEQIRHVLAHEHFHTWNGLKLHIDGPEGSNYWFSEGFTEYFTRRMLRRAGLWDDKALLDDINRSLAEYDANPKRHAPNTQVQRDFWTDPDISKLPYRRGDLLALCLDEKIRAASAGKRSLDDVIRELVTRVRGGAPAPDREAVLALFQAEVGPEFMAGVRACIEDGIDPPLPARLGEPACELASGAVRGFDPGFDTQASGRDKQIVGINPGSGAQEAGLRDGMPLRSASIGAGGPAAAPRGEVEVQIDGAWRKITYDAVGPKTQVRRYKPDISRP